MKRQNILMTALLICCLTACDKHDFFDDLTITGNIGPQAYWEIESDVVAAGTQMGFSAQYYTALKDIAIDRSEVWYDLNEELEKTVSCPWVTSFTYTYNSIVTEQKRVSQKIAEYYHDDVATWSDSLHAYAFKDAFPVSATLKPFKWSYPQEFDASAMDLYFGEGFMQHFKDSLYSLMKFEDFRKMYLGLGLREDFKEFTDSTFDINANAYTYHFPWNIDSTDTPIPADVERLYRDSISFDQLVLNTAENNYAVEYKRSYYIRALLRVYDERNVYGTTEMKTININ
ncbi:MAG: hypothetical protein NC038_08055 [Paludibacter sp.]|nr:hypothetical protein [Bacteroidales bacterium]MCM1069718.1 hypothetical protein [Prevotella sp.]MCM1354374.1 hypothetical protein [Bacteroides sp.]MCM1441921.1 hypothetical protein [Muribaculum sp.]MCM1482572.1 hypothetical protein [Paludibacter sp.]